MFHSLFKLGFISEKVAYDQSLETKADSAPWDEMFLDHQVAEESLNMFKFSEKVQSTIWKGKIGMESLGMLYHAHVIDGEDLPFTPPLSLWFKL